MMADSVAPPRQVRSMTATSPTPNNPASLRTTLVAEHAQPIDRIDGHSAPHAIFSLSTTVG